MRAIGIDVGGTKTALALVDTLTGSIAARETFASPGGDDDHAALLDQLVERAAALARQGAEAIGVSVCELVDPRGQVTSGHRIRWKGLGVQERFAAILPALVESDVRAAARAEARLGAGRGCDSFLYANIGTGISSAFVVAGVVHAGARGNALAFASGPTSLLCPHCGAPAAVVLEEIAGGAGLLAGARRAGLPVAVAADIFALAEAGDAVAQHLAEAAVTGLGTSLGLALNLLDPGALILGGGLIHAAPGYRARAVASIRSHVWAPATRSLPIVLAELGPDAALIGAAITAAERFQGMSSPKLR